jgi:hypothetical protein
MFENLASVFSDYFFPRQRRRKSFRTSAAAIDALEQRQLLTVPGAINVTEAVLGTGDSFLHRPVVVQWEPDAAADSYEYWISDGQNNYSDPLSRPYIGSVAGTQLEFNGGIVTSPGFEIGVWIRGINDEGAGSWSAKQPVIVPDGLAPGVPQANQNNGPSVNANSSYYIPSTTNLRFDVAPARDTDEVGETQDVDGWLSRDGEVLSSRGEYFLPTGRSGDRTALTFDYHLDSGNDIPSGLYRVWFRGRNGVGVSDWTEPVTIGVGGSQPEITGPSSNSQPARPEITWSEGVPGTDYQIWIQPQGGSVLISEGGISGTSYTPDVDLENGIYYAYVRQVADSGGSLPWSSRFQFEVGTSTLPQVPQLTLVPNTLEDELENFRPLFQWAADPNAVRFDLYVAEGLNGTAVIRETQLTGTEFFGPTLPQDGGVHYRAWLRAFGSDGTVTAWSAFVEFRVFSDGRVVPAGS